MLTRNQFFVKEHVGLLKTRDAFDIFDVETEEKIGEVVETTPNWAVMARLVLSKQVLPKTIEIRDVNDDEPVVTLEKGMTLFRSKVFIVDRSGEKKGYLLSKVFSLGGGFDIYDMSDKKVAELKGDWKGWNFTMKDAGGGDLGTISKKWAGMAKEIFTTADNYIISLSPQASSRGAGVKIMLLAAGIAVDTVYKEVD